MQDIKNYVPQTNYQKQIIRTWCPPESEVPLKLPLFKAPHCKTLTLGPPNFLLINTPFQIGPHTAEGMIF